MTADSAKPESEFIPATCPNGHVFYPPAIRLRDRAVYHAHAPITTGSCPQCGTKGVVTAGIYVARDGKVERITGGWEA